VANCRWMAGSITLPGNISLSDAPGLQARFNVTGATG